MKAILLLCLLMLVASTFPPHRGGHMPNTLICLKALRPTTSALPLNDLRLLVDKSEILGRPGKVKKGTPSEALKNELRKFSWLPLQDRAACN